MNRYRRIDGLKVDQVLELVCQQGCVSVKETINRLERGKFPETVQHLSTEECERLLDELKTVMHTYE